LVQFIHKYIVNDKVIIILYAKKPSHNHLKMIIKRLLYYRYAYA